MPANQPPLIITCSESKVRKYMRDYYSSVLKLPQDLDSCPIIANAGGIKLFLRPIAPDGGLVIYNLFYCLLNQVSDFAKLGFSRVLLINHSDCNEYGGKNAFPSRDMETEKHLADLRVMKDDLQTYSPFPLEIEAHYVFID